MKIEEKLFQQTIEDSLAINKTLITGRESLAILRTLKGCAL